MKGGLLIIGYDDYRLYNLDRIVGSIKQDATGIQKSTGRGDTVASRVLNGTSSGLVELAVKIKQDAVGMAPKDTGALRAEAFVQQTGTISDPTVEIVFPSPYALYVHEDMEAKHTNGEARFLAKAVAQNLGETQRVMVTNVGSYIASGVRGTPYGVPFGSYTSTAGAEASAVGMVSGI